MKVRKSESANPRDFPGDRQSDQPPIFPDQDVLIPARILIVDDDPIALKSMETLLEGPNRLIVKAETGQDALRYLLRQDFAVILLDIRMPLMDGYETAALVRQRERSRYTPIIFLSGIDTMDADVVRGLMSGAVDYLVKPIVPDILKNKVSVFVDLYRLRERVKQQAVWQTEERFRLLVDGVQDYAIFMLDRAGLVTTWNKGAERLTGYQSGEILGRHYECFYPEEEVGLGQAAYDLQSAVEAAEAVEDSRAEQDRWMIRKDSTRFIANVVVTSLKNEQDILQGYAIVIRDVTERRRAYLALRESEAWQSGQKEAFQAAMNGASLQASLGALVRTAVQYFGGEARAAFYLPNDNGATLTHAVGMSDAYAREVEGFKMSADSLAWGLAMDRSEPVVTPDVNCDPRWQPWLWLAQKHNYRACWSFPVRTSDGPALGTLALYFSEPRQPTARDFDLTGVLTHAATMIISRHREVTERARAEESMRESEVRFRNVFEHAGTGIAIATLDGSFVQCNPAYRAMLGYTEEEFRHLTFSQLVYPDDRAADLAEIERLLSGKVPSFNIENRYVHKNGQLMWGDKFVSILRDHAGEPKYLVVLVTNVTERRRADQALHEAQERLQRWNEELEQAVNVKTAELHQSQERLRAMATELNLSEQRERKRMATELHDHLQQMLALGRLKLAQGKRLAKSMPPCAKVIKDTDEILSNALKYTSTLVAELSPPALRDHGLVAGLEWLGEAMKQHDMDVALVAPKDDVLKLPEDQAILLFQSVRELLINSWKHATTNNATVTLERQADALRIEVRDQGKGFDPAVATAPAATTDSVPSSKFGLFSIRERMRALGGSFAIESAPSRGTKATLTLPLAPSSEVKVCSSEWAEQPANAPHAPQSVPNPRSFTQGGPLHKKKHPIRVVLVDDHAMMRQGLCSLLEEHKEVQVVGEASDGLEAIKLAGALQPDVVVMDVTMPRVDGIEATRQIRQAHPAIAVVLLSVYSAARGEAVMKAAGATTFISKASAGKDLYDAIMTAAGAVRSQG